MKRVLLVSLFAALFAGCNKDDASHNDSFYFMCKIDGVDKTFNVNMFGNKETSGANHGYIAGGFAKGGADSESFAILINNVPGENDITTGTYTDSDTTVAVLGSYTDIYDFDYDAGTALYNSVDPGQITNHFQLVISALDENAIAGTFKGSFYKESDVTSTRVEVTEGKFRIKLTPP